MKTTYQIDQKKWKSLPSYFDTEHTSITPANFSNPHDQNLPHFETFCKNELPILLETFSKCIEAGLAAAAEKDNSPLAESLSFEFNEEIVCPAFTVILAWSDYFHNNARLLEVKG